MELCLRQLSLTNARVDIRVVPDTDFAGYPASRISGTTLVEIEGYYK